MQELVLWKYNIDNPLIRLIKKKRNTKECKKYYEKLYANILDNLDEMDTFLDTYYQ